MIGIRQSLILSFLEKYTGMVAAVVSTIVLARLLTPDEIGLFAVAAAFTPFAHRIREFGVGQYIIQETELTQDKIRSAFTFTLVIAWIIAGLFFSLGGFVAEIFEEPTARWILAVLAINFVIVPFGSVSLALLHRHMQFGTIYKINATGAVVHAVTVISLAAMDVGVMSLAWASASGAVATVAMTQFYRPAEMVFQPTFRAWRQIASFGGMSTGAALVFDLGNAATEIILGRVLGFAAVGYYSRAQGLLATFNRYFLGAVHNVAFPTYAAAHRSGRVLKEPYLLSLTNITVFAWPFFVFVAILAHPIVRTLFGAQWDAAVPLVRILALAGLIFGVWMLAGPVAIAGERIKDYFRAELLIHGSRIVLVVVVVSYGLEAVAGAQILVFLIGFFVYYFILHRMFMLNLADIFHATWRSLGVTVCSSAIAAGLVLIWGIEPNDVLVPLIIGTLGALVGWILGLFVFRHPFCQEIVIAYNWLLGKARNWV